MMRVFLQTGSEHSFVRSLNVSQLLGLISYLLSVRVVLILTWLTAAYVMLRRHSLGRHPALWVGLEDVPVERPKEKKGSLTCCILVCLFSAGGPLTSGLLVGVSAIAFNVNSFRI